MTRLYAHEQAWNRGGPLLFIPGVGNIYNGTFLRGIFWLVLTPGLWLGSAGWFGWICHLVAAYTAYSYAESREPAPTQPNY